MASLSRYLINFLLDATVGMLLIYVGVRAVSVLVEWQQWESLRFGEYGNVHGHWVECVGDYSPYVARKSKGLGAFGSLPVKQKGVCFGV